MSDEHLRALERRWRTHGDLHDLVAWLRALVREGSVPASGADLATRIEAGTLTRDHLRLAALLGEPAARVVALDDVAERCAYLGLDRAVDVATDAAPASRDDLYVWLMAIASFGRPCLARALFGATRPLLLVLERFAPAADEDPYGELRRDRGYALERVGLVFAATATCLERPDNETRNALRGTLWEEGWYRTATDLPGRVQQAVMECAIVALPDEKSTMMEQPANEAIVALAGDEGRRIRAWLIAVGDDLTPAQVCDAVRADLLPRVLR